MQVLLVGAGLALVLTSGWFSGQHTVGWVLLGLAIAITVVQLAALALVAWVGSRSGVKVRRRKR